VFSKITSRASRGFLFLKKKYLFDGSNKIL